MQFLKTLFWVGLAIVLVLFTVANRQAVTINLWGGLELDTKLPVLVFGSFLLGFLPTFLLYRARVWSLRRRLDAHERNAAGIQSSFLQPSNPDAAAQAAPQPASPATVTQFP